MGHLQRQPSHPTTAEHIILQPYGDSLPADTQVGKLNQPNVVLSTSNLSGVGQFISRLQQVSAARAGSVRFVQERAK